MRELAEVANGMRRSFAVQRLDAQSGWTAPDVFDDIGMTRYPTFAPFERVWELRNVVSADDATYVALAEHLGCSLVTSDGRLARAPGVRCPITLVPL